MTLRLVAEYADLWNAFGPAATYARKNKILDDWCARVGRDPGTIERTVIVEQDEVDQVDEFLTAGATHLIISTGAPFHLGPVERILERAS